MHVLHVCLEYMNEKKGWTTVQAFTVLIKLLNINILFLSCIYFVFKRGTCMK